MNNYHDYQLEDMEDSAINNSNKFKKAAAVGAAVFGVGGTAAYAATKLNDGLDASADDLTAEDLVGMAEAGAIEDDAINVAETPAQPAATTETVEIHVHHHNDPVAPEPEPQVSIDETGVVFDEEGNVVNVFDKGSIDGKDFIVMDTDGNGSGDVLAYDENGNGRYEDNEVTQLDNQSYQMGQGQHAEAYYKDAAGNIHHIGSIDDIMHGGDSIEAKEYAYDNTDSIHNDFLDEKNSGEFKDFAHNNPDYDNHHDYSAAVADYTQPEHDAYVEPFIEQDYTDKYDGVDSESFAYDETPDSDNADFYAETSYDGSDDLAANDFTSDAVDFNDPVDYSAI